MQELMKVVGEQGFPIIVSVYLLVRFESKIDSLERVISGLNTEIQKLYLKFNSE